MKQKGFTLMKVLVALLILSLILAVAVNTFTAILRSAAKAKALAEVKQNGQYALGVMERMIRNARRISTCSSNKITIENPDGGETSFRFDLVENLIASQSGEVESETDRLTSGKVKLDSGQFSCIDGEGTQGDIVAINFSLSQAGADSDLTIENRFSASFETTVVLRNY